MAITWSQVPGSPSGTISSPATCASASSAYAIVLPAEGFARYTASERPAASSTTSRGPSEFRFAGPPCLSAAPCLHTRRCHTRRSERSEVRRAHRAGARRQHVHLQLEVARVGRGGLGHLVLHVVVLHQLHQALVEGLHPVGHAPLGDVLAHLL